MNKKKNIEKLITEIEDLPVLPSVAMKILTKTLNEESSAQEISKEVDLDQSLTAKLLRTANSSYYGHSGRIKTVKDSIVILGFRTVKNLILNISVFNTLEGKHPEITFDKEKFWLHCFGCAVGSRLISERIGLPESDDAYVVGLLHDIGKIVLYCHFQQDFKNILALVNEEFLTVKEAEEKVLGINHGVVGKILLEKWQIPLEIVEAVCHHHNPKVELFTAGSAYLLASTVSLADTLSHILNLGSGGDENPRILQQRQLDAINLRREDLNDIALQMEEETYETARSLGGFRPLEQQSLFDLLVKAQDKLWHMNQGSAKQKMVPKQQADQAGESHAEEIFDNTPIGLFVINQEKKIIKCNQTAARIFGHNQDDMLGQHLTKLIPKRYRNFHYRPFGAVMGHPENSCQTHEFIGLRKQGDEFPVELSFSLVEKDQDSFMVVTARDISFRKKMETEMKEKTDVLQEYLKLHNQWLVETEQKYNFLFEASKTGICYLKKDGTFLDINRVAEEILGRDKNTMLGKPLSHIMPEAQRDKSAVMIGKIIKDVFEYKAAKIMEGLIVNSAGAEIPVEFSFREIANRDDSQVVCMIRDVSKIKQIEDQLIRSQKLASFSVLAGGMLHNFKNIMSSILGYASLVKTLVPDNNKLGKYINIIETSCSRAADLAKEVLTLGRKQDTAKKLLNANEIIERSILLFEQCTDTRHTIRKKLDPDLQPAELNESQIEQVLLNLLINARDAMPDGGEILVETRNALLSQEVCKEQQNVIGASFIEILVKDNGVGIPKDLQSKIFDPFFTTKEEGKGTGLGLSTVDRIVKNHWGFLEIYSKEGVGTTFKINIPAYEKAFMNGKEKKDNDFLRQGSETILAIDDENNVIRMMSEALCVLGYNLITASSGKQALDLFRKNRSEIDLIILDLVMPSMGGYEVFKEIKTIEPSAKIILCTGYVTDEHIQKMLGEGVKGLLRKPYRIEDLSRAIRLVLDEQPAGVVQSSYSNSTLPA